MWRAHKLESLAAACAVALTVGNASAQTTAETPDAAAGGFSLEGVVVTARKREENLQDVPIAITALSGNELEQRGLGDVAALSSSAPNLEINNGRPDGGGSTAQIYIRGVGQNDFLIPNDPGVGLYVDDVYVSRSSGAITGLMDIQSVEVLRGPQGTLYGKNTIGGAVRITTIKPSFDATSGRMGLTLGSYDRVDFNGSVNLPVNEMFAVRVAGSMRTTDDIGKRVLDPSGQGTGNINEDAIRLIARYQPASDLEIVLSADYTRARQHGPYGANSAYLPNALTDALNNEYYPTINASLGLPADSRFDSRYVSGPKTDYGTGPNQNDFDTRGVSAVVSYDINDQLSLKSITAYRNVDSVAGRDGDHSPYPLLSTIVTDDNRQFSQELQLNGSFERFKWTTGLYYLREDLRDRYNTRLWDGLVTTSIPIDFNARSLSTLEGTSVAIFGQGTYQLSDAWSLTLGGRYNQEKKDFRNRWYFLEQPREYTCPGIDVRGNFDDCNKTEHVFTPMASLGWKVTPDVLLYTSYSEGFKAGGWTPRLFSQTSLERNDPEKLRAYEVGIKSQWFEDRLIVNADVFRSDYTDLQLTSVLADANGSPQPVVQNAGKARIDGFELESTAQITRYTRVQLSVGLLDGKYLELDPGVQANIHLDYKLPDTPAATAGASIQQDFPLRSGATASARVDAAYKGKTYKEPGNSPYNIQDPYTLINARVAYLSVGGNWEVAAYVTNLTDEQYLVNGLDLAATFGFVESYYGRPREAGVQLEIHF